MPISLPPVSRRQFLARTLIAGAGMVVAPQLFAAPKANDETLCALVSDPHIAAKPGKMHCHINMRDRFATVVREISEMPVNPAGVFVNGDCAFYSGETEDYAAFASLLEPLREAEIPIHLTLGNHDNRDRFWQALESQKAAEQPLEDKHTAFVSTPCLNWFMLDSLEATNSLPGLLGATQLDWLAKTLDENQTKPAVIMLHHNLDTGSTQNSGLKDSEALFQIIRPRPQVKACIYGHTHAWDVKLDESGIHLVNLPPTSYVYSQGAPVGWVLGTLTDDGLRLELRCLDKQHEANGETHRLKWRS
jgi:hypothetical protein